MNLESRLCEHCDKSFRVLYSSPQIFCSDYCRNLAGADLKKGQKWTQKKEPLKFGEAKNQSQKEKSGQELEPGRDIMKTLSSQERSNELGTQKISTKIETEVVEGITQIKNKNLSEKDNGQETTKAESMSTEENTTKQIEQSYSSALKHTEEENSPGLVLRQQLTGLREEISPTMSLVDSSVKQLITANEELSKADTKGFFEKTQKVHALSQGARGIAELLKIKTTMAIEFRRIVDRGF